MGGQDVRHPGSMSAASNTRQDEMDKRSDLNLSNAHPARVIQVVRKWELASFELGVSIR